MILKNAAEIYRHYGVEEDKKAVKDQRIEAVDFLIGKEQDLEALTCNMAGFGTEQSQRVIIEYDKGFGYFLVKRMKKEYGAPGKGRQVRGREVRR